MSDHADHVQAVVQHGEHFVPSVVRRCREWQQHSKRICRNAEIGLEHSGRGALVLQLSPAASLSAGAIPEVQRFA